MYTGGYIILRDDISAFINSLLATTDSGSIHIENSYNYAKSVISSGKPLRSVMAESSGEYIIVLYTESNSALKQSNDIVFQFSSSNVVITVTFTKEDNVLVSFGA